jgi:hypothetical protein
MTDSNLVKKLDSYTSRMNKIKVRDIFHRGFGDDFIYINSDDDEALRKYSCGSDRITVLNGTSSYRGPHDDFIKTMGLAEDDFNASNIMNMGILAEDVFRRRTEQMAEHLGLYGNTRVLPGETLYRHGRNVTYRATPDGIIPDNPSVVFEYKLRWWSDKDLYGEPMTDQVRESEFDQCQWHMFLSDATTCFLGVWFHPADDIEWFKILRNDKHIAALVDCAEDYFGNHIKTSTPPPSDASDGCKKYLMRLEERDAARREMSAEEWHIAMRIHETKEQIKELKGLQQGFENELRESIGEMQELFVEGSKSKVTCKAPKGKDTRTLRVTIKD